VVAIVASVVIPLAMSASTDVTGALQRAMFAIAYLWYGREAVAAMHSPLAGDRITAEH
jgi:hypothetical protein